MLGGDLSYIGLAVGSGIVTTAALGGLGLAFSPTLQRKVLPPPRESLFSDLLPFHHIAEDQETLVCKDGTWSKVIFLEGLDYGIKTEEERLALLNTRQQGLDVLAKDGISLSVVTHRTAVLSSFGEDVFPNHPVLKEMNKRWEQTFERTYDNRYYVILSQERKQQKSFFSKKESLNAARSQALQKWHELAKTVLDYLRDYRPHVLKETGFNPDQGQGGLLSFWSHLVNGFDDHPVFGVKDHVSKRLVSSTIHFDPQTGFIEWNDGTKKLYGLVVSIQLWGEDIWSTIFRELLQLPCAFRLVHWLKGYTSLQATKELELGLRGALTFFSNEYSKNQFYTALEWVQSDQGSLYEIQTSVFLTADSKDYLLEMMDRVRALFRSQGLKPVQETQAAETLWLSQLPSFTTRLRGNKLFSKNIANLLSFSKDQKGLDHSDWGKGPLRMFKTSTGSLYKFQLHVSERPAEVAHSLILAPSGSGKTTLFQHLIGGALRHAKLQAYIFDRFSGTRIFTEAIGGKVIDLSDGETLSLNPLQCSDTEANRTFLLDFLLQLADTRDDASLQAASRAVDALFEVPLEMRSLNAIYQSAIDMGSPLKKSLLKWTGDSPLGRFFNGAEDSLDIQKNRLVTFEMGNLQETPLAYAAMLRYTMHRIREQVRFQALPHLIFIDESAPMLENALFREYTKQLFREHRKLRGSITVCFQDPSAIAASGLKDTILSQCQTVFLFPNPNAQQEDFAIFDLTDDQWAFIKGTSSLKLKHGVLVKRTTPESPEAVFLDCDLSSLGPYLKLYQSGSEAVTLVKQLQHQYGPDWVSAYVGEKP